MMKRSMFRLRNNSVVFRNFIKMFIVCIMVFALVFVAVYIFATDYAQKNAIENNKSSLDKVAELSDIIFKQMEYVATGLAVDPTVNMLMGNYERPYLTKNRLDSLEAEMKSFLLTYKSAYEYVDSIYIYSSSNRKIFNGTVIESIDEFADDEWIKKIESSGGADFTYFPRKQNGIYPYYITFIKRINNYSFIVVNINVMEIRDVLNNSVAKDAHFTITDDTGMVFYSSGMEEFAQITQLPETGMIKDGKDKFFFCSQKDSEYFDWNYTLTEPDYEYNSNLNFLRTIFFITLFFLILLSVIAAGVLAMLSGKPLRELINIFDEKGYAEESNSDETAYLAQRIIRIIDDNKYLKEELDKRLAMYNQLQLISLQEQINPHFLNNALNSIIYILRIKDNKKDAVSSLVSLSRLVGYSYVHDEILVSLKEELDFLHDYISFQKIRYGEFQVMYDIDKETLEIRIPRLSLQTLVENALFHAIGENPEKGILKISAKKDEDKIAIEIRDNGKGMDCDKIEEIMNNVVDEKMSKKYVGIKNVFKRFNLIFGENVECILESRKDEYTAVRMVIKNFKK